MLPDVKVRVRAPLDFKEGFGGRLKGWGRQPCASSQQVPAQEAAMVGAIGFLFVKEESFLKFIQNPSGWT